MFLHPDTLSHAVVLNILQIQFEHDTSDSDCDRPLKRAPQPDIIGRNAQHTHRAPDLIDAAWCFLFPQFIRKIVSCLSIGQPNHIRLGNIDLEVAKSSFLLSNLIQGFGLSLTFVPLTATAMGLLRKEQMGNASGLFNLMRNLGASVGISLATTMVARGAQAHQATLVTHLTPLDPVLQSRLQAMRAALAQQMTAAQAQIMAPGVIYKSLLQQSNLLAYVDDFRWLALLCFVSIPLVFFLKKVSATGSVSVH